VSQGYNIELDAPCPTTTTDLRITNKNTQLVDPNLANNGGPTQTHALLAGSPAIGVIPNIVGFVPSTDQRGVPASSAMEAGFRVLRVGGHRRSRVCVPHAADADALLMDGVQRCRG
jgi:hypothetical protein